MLFVVSMLLFSLMMHAIASPIPLDDATNTLSRRITHGGRGTYFYPGDGNCGGWSTDKDPIVAISTQIYNDGGNCGQWVEITNTDNSQVAYGLVQDSCPSCAPGSLDMSPAVFQQLAPLYVGDIPISWHYMSREWSP
ncbi:RlpA-like double-psi beta-barrel-protein domain-containing protein-containing protein [Hysterangium stoloniferum]|nr:RlpA-like double-psi beta-barrel-protein domain-containing protein-containing protein [Hysterangium stoloniferum]